MNISGREYSRATVGLRQPQQILDQQLKLVFIYPMLVDQKLQKYVPLLRSFISTSMLREIYTSNALNIMSMASSISPLIDEAGNIVDITGSSPDAMKDINVRDTQQRVIHDVERRVQEKTQHIRKLMDVDPKLAQYKPHLQMITLNNFIDVPVIVGTKSYPIEPYIFLFLFTIAISSRGNISMTSYSDIERMFRIIRSMDTNNVNQILNNLIDLPSKDVFDRIADWFADHPRVDRQLRIRGISWINTPARWVRDVGRAARDRLRRDDLRTRVEEDTVNYPGVSQDLAQQIFDITQNQVQQSSVFFKLAMDPESMAAQFGYEPERGQLKHTFDRINPRINEVFDNGEIYFTRVLWSNYINPTLSSFLYTIVPTRSGVNVSDLIVGMQNGDDSRNIQGMIGPLVEYLKGDFKTSLNSSLEREGPERADEILSKIKSLCQDHFEEANMLFTELTEVRNHRITGQDYNIDQHIEYERHLENAINSISAMTSTLDGILRDILPNQIVDDIMENHTSRVINDSINSVVAHLGTFQDYPESTGFIRTTGIQDNQAQEISNYIAESRKQMIFYIRFMVLKTILYILCQYVKETKVAVETTKHDVLDQNNYTIVTSVEVILAVANAFAAKSYRDLVEKSRRGEDGQAPTQLMRDLGNRYIKGVVKHMHQQLQVPNLIVIDENTQDVYYKLMYQSSVNKMKLNTMQTFVDNALDS